MRFEYASKTILSLHILNSVEEKEPMLDFFATGPQHVACRVSALKRQQEYASEKDVHN